MAISCQNGFPAFFADVQKIRLYDPLAAFLGAAESGILEYSYADAVKLAGHSCPTVAASYLAVAKGLKALYGEELPVRGEVEVLMARGREEGTVGVVASIAQLLTGAAAETGFAGIGIAKRFSRRNLLSFDQPTSATFCLRRKDTGKTVKLTFNLDAVAPWSEEVRALMPKAFNNQANAEELARFAELWQTRVRQILVDFANDERLILVESR